MSCSKEACPNFNRNIAGNESPNVVVVACENQEQTLPAGVTVRCPLADAIDIVGDE